MANQGGELLLGRDAIVAPSIAERLRDKAAAMIEESGGGDGGYSGDDAAIVDDAASRRRVAMYLAVVAPLLFVAAIIASAAIVGEPRRADVAAANRAIEGDLLQQPAAQLTPVLSAGGAIEPPAGAQLTSMALDDARIALHFRGDHSEEIIIYDLASGAPASRLVVKTAAPAAMAMSLESVAAAPQPALSPVEPVAASAPAAPRRKPLTSE